MKAPLGFLALGAASAVMVCCLMVPGSFSFGEVEPGALVKAVTDSSFSGEVLKSPLPVLVDFWATWCGPCRMYGPIVDRLAVDYKGRLKVVRVDVDQNPGLSKRFQIQAIPTSLLMKKGQVLKTLVGVRSQGDMEKIIGQVLKKFDQGRS